MKIADGFRSLLSIKTDKINVFSKDGTRNLTHAN